MKRILLWFSFGLVSWSVNAQINFEDSTAQVVGYWSAGDQQHYRITYHKFKMSALDTTVSVGMTYDVKIKVQEVEAAYQLIEWTYTDVQMMSDDVLTQLLGTMIEDLTIVIRMNEFGSFMEVVNWEEVAAFIRPSLEQLLAEFGEDPNEPSSLSRAITTYLTREGLESFGINDMLQFYGFHGGRYKLGVNHTVNIQVGNQYGGQPFDARVEIVVDELNDQEDYVILRAHQEVDAVQLTEATISYLKSGGNGDQDEEIITEAMKLLTKNMYTASQIHGSTGWPVYSVETIVTRAGLVGEIEERIIQLIQNGK